MFELFSQEGGLGIEITTKYVRFVHLKKKKRTFVLQNFGRIAVPQDTFVDGTLVKPQTLETILKAVFKESPEKNIRIVLPGDSLLFSFLSIPSVSPEEVVSEIKFALKENVLFNEGRDTVVDYIVLGTEDGTTTLRTVSAPVSWFKQWNEVFMSFPKLSLHIERANQASLVMASHSEESDPFIHLQFGDDFCSISVIDRNKVVRYQELPFSTYRFLVETQKRLSKPSLVASQYLATLGVLGADVCEFAEEVLRPLAVLVDHTITEYGQDSTRFIKRVSLGGAFGGYKGVSEILSKFARIAVSPLDCHRTLDTVFDKSIYDMKKTELSEYSVSLGLAILSLSSEKKR